MTPLSISIRHLEKKKDKCSYDMKYNRLKYILCHCKTLKVFCPLKKFDLFFILTKL